MRSLLIFLFLLIIIPLSGQVPWQSRDAVTYQQYLNREWKALLKEVNASLDDGVDFYYLRVRAGIAAYELKKYRQAADHFARAYRWNQHDDFLNYWYYYALIMSGRSDEAYYLTANLPSHFLYRMEIPGGKLFNGIISEAQFTQNIDYQRIIGEVPSGSDSYVLYRNIPQQQIYSGIGLEHQLSSRWMVFQGLSRLSIHKNQYFKASGIDQAVFLDSKVTQYQYYLQGRYFIGNGWQAIAGLTLIGGAANNHAIDEDVLGRKLIVPYQYGINDHFLQLGIARDFSWLRIGGSASAGSVDGFTQLQGGGQFTIYPLGSAKFFLHSDLDIHYDFSANRMKYIAQPGIGSKIGPFWILAERSFGEIQNFSSAYGYVVYNAPEIIKNLTSATITLPLMNYRLWVMARYLNASKEASVYDYTDKETYTTSPYSYTEAGWLLSLKWYFH